MVSFHYLSFPSLGEFKHLWGIDEELNSSNSPAAAKGGKQDHSSFVDSIPKQSSGQGWRLHPGSSKLHAAGESGKPLQDCWMGPRMSASFSIYWLWLPCVTLTLLLNTGLFAFLRLLAKWGVHYF